MATRRQRQMSKDTQDNVGMSYLDSNATKFFKIYLPLLIFLFVLLFPFYWMGITTFKPDNELLSRDGNPFCLPLF
jgi:multiple sugar transport system permease protein